MEILYIGLGGLVLLGAIVFLSIKYGKKQANNDNLKDEIELRDKMAQNKPDKDADSIIETWKKVDKK